MEEALSELSQRIRTALASPIRDDRTIDPLRELAAVLDGVGLDLGSTGGKITFTGRDPIVSSPLPLATMAAIGLMAKAVSIAELWRFRRGGGQDLFLHLRDGPSRPFSLNHPKRGKFDGKAPRRSTGASHPVLPAYNDSKRHGGPS